MSGHSNLWGPQLALSVEVQGLSRTMLVLVPAIALPVVLYAWSSERDNPARPRLLALLVGFVGAMELLVSAGDFLTLLLAWELVGAISWALIAYEWGDVDRVRAARDAFLVTRFGDLGLYAAAAALFTATGTLRFDALSALHGGALAVVAGGVLLAAAAKSAQIPFSPWLFSAMRGPTPASALLHSATMVAAGAYLLARLTPALGAAVWFAPTVAWLGLATALAGGVVASLQPDLKRALAASTSAQYGMMFLAIGAGYSGAAGLHLVAHAGTKALLFLAAGIVAHVAGTLDLGRLAGAGIGRTHRQLSRLALIGALSLAAVPPLGGAYSKEMLVTAAAAAPFAAGWLTGGMYVAALLSGFYAARIWLLGFLGSASRVDDAAPATGTAEPTPRLEVLALAMLALFVIALGALYLPGTASLTGVIAGGVLPPAESWWRAAISIVPAVLGVAGAWLFYRRGVLATDAMPATARMAGATWFGIPAATRRIVVSPGLALSRMLARADERVVDAGIRVAARLGELLSSGLAGWGERAIRGGSRAISLSISAISRTFARWTEAGLEGLVRGSAQLTVLAATGSGIADDRGVDRVVEGLALGIGATGAESRRLQTGLAHDYYRMIAIGVVVLVLLLTAAVLVHGRTT